ncbi:bifunctional phosphopantothenoylcysteine decarboxylase/phosphopantothenate--cysteine ligase CoaBC [Schaalia vaccimaxillae]|uniref:bifunctional phosphopantothenoylcysteine decarboxylase/phosphopantothenate--cysteine ligase CoaBC n=1 Tax=Schaalia vaccimaxillae TaxID=183916 RepID=UPI0003B462E0|nr:bifunctional phosphopantothenoylcysteine decarboxylase/phosphopantothenate--cysteine ligase CoaBC [Schaalia vaccimaxillae]
MSRTIIVGVTAGIAAYKAASLVRELIKAGHDVHIVPTPASTQFIGTATWEGLTGNPVHTGVFDAGGADHIELARRADLIVVAPATADFIARTRAGIADDLLTTTILASSCPVIIAPAMHTQMWLSQATQDNVETLKSRGVIFIAPEDGALGSGDFGVGRMAAPQAIAWRALNVLTGSAGNESDLALTGCRVLITAGGTREPIDPVRFIGNSSSGRQGVALARAASDAGANVTLIASNIDASILNELPSGISIVSAPSAAEVEKSVMERLNHIDVVIMAAAIADFRPKAAHDSKIKKDPLSTEAPTIALEQTTDILAAVAQSSDRPSVLVGFAAETGTLDEVLELGRQKALRKNADLLAVNRVGHGHGFGDVDNSVYVLDHLGKMVGQASGTKSIVAQELISMIALRLGTIAR